MSSIQITGDMRILDCRLDHGVLRRVGAHVDCPARFAADLNDDLHDLECGVALVP